MRWQDWCQRGSVVAEFVYDRSYSGEDIRYSQAALNRRQYPPGYGVAAIVIFVLLATGVVGTIIAPGRVSGLGVPLGFGLWAVLAWLLEQRDRRRTDAR